MRFANRTNWVAHSNDLNNVLEALQATGAEVLDLTQSNPTQAGFQYPKDLLNSFNKLENLSYVPDANGMAHARVAVADYYVRRNVACRAEDILLTASTSEAYSFLLRLMVNPGERVLIPRPSYPLFQFLLEINDVAFDYYPLVYSDGWHIDRQALANLIDDKTRAIILVNPNNPTGSFLNSDELEFLNTLAVKHQLALISDEVFFDYAWGKGDLRSLAGNSKALTFTLSGLSKILALPQMKAAWIFASGPQAELKQAMARLDIIADTYLSVNTPVQNALGSWLTDEQVIQSQINERVKLNWQFLEANLDKHAQLLKVQGGWYATLRIPAIKSEEQWVLEFLKEDHVLVHPGYFFDFYSEAYIIISLITPPEIFKQATNRLMKRIALQTS